MGYNKDSNPPTYKILNSLGTGWGNVGYADIAIVNGEGICGIQREATIPNLLVTADTVQTSILFALLGFAALAMLPLSFYFWHLAKQNLHFLHPGQLILRKVMWFELFYIFFAIVLLVIGETSTTVWNVETADIFFVLFCVNVTFMILHYALGALNKFSDDKSHLGCVLTNKVSTIIMCIILLLVTIFGW